ncbi:aldo/keto reductase [Chitinophaga defluvii]|uniref:Aldo/keto reductase n=1 Tax=Chitinophaga defluvii TaxID=3163343 RepID=A0ABV2SZ17_9BACT
MKKKALGSTGIQVSEIAFGGVEIGMPYGIGVNSEADMLPETAAIALLHEALDGGINFFDTARMYGNSEQIMGKAFHDRRQSVVLCSKCRHLRDVAGKLPPDNVLKQLIHTSLQESLASLQTDYLDVYMLHYGDAEILANPTIAAVFSGLQQSGVVRAIGLSVYTPKETALALKAGIWEVIQLPFNLLDQRQAVHFAAAEEQGTAIVVRSVLCKGLLSDRAKQLHPALDKVAHHIAGYNELLKDSAMDLPGLATRFALSFDAVSSILVGIDRSIYLQQAVKTAAGPVPPAAIIDRARELAYPDPEFLNLHHWHQMGWLP